VIAYTRKAITSVKSVSLFLGGFLIFLTLQVGLALRGFQQGLVHLLGQVVQQLLVRLEVLEDQVRPFIKN